VVLPILHSNYLLTRCFNYIKLARSSINIIILLMYRCIIGHWDYVWTTQHHSVETYPTIWSPPVRLLDDFIHRDLSSAPLGIKPDEAHSNVLTSFNTYSAVNREEQCRDLGGDDSTELPSALPLQCTAQHLHRWVPRSSTDTDALSAEKRGLDESSRGYFKVVCLQGTIYRFDLLSGIGIY